MNERPLQPYLIPIFVGMLVNAFVLPFLASMVPMAIPLFLILHHVGIALFAWDVYQDPERPLGPKIGWIAALYLFWILAMPVYIYLLGRARPS